MLQRVLWASPLASAKPGWEPHGPYYCKKDGKTKSRYAGRTGTAGACELPYVPRAYELLDLTHKNPGNLSGAGRSRQTSGFGCEREAGLSGAEAGARQRSRRAKEDLSAFEVKKGDPEVARSTRTARWIWLASKQLKREYTNRTKRIPINRRFRPSLYKWYIRHNRICRVFRNPPKR